MILMNFNIKISFHMPSIYYAYGRICIDSTNPTLNKHIYNNVCYSYGWLYINCHHSTLNEHHCNNICYSYRMILYWLSSFYLKWTFVYFTTCLEYNSPIGSLYYHDWFLTYATNIVLTTIRHNQLLV